MQGEIRVTVIATGFDRHLQLGVGAAGASQDAQRPGPNVLPFPRGEQRPAPVGRVLNAGARVAPASEAAARPRSTPLGTERQQGSQDLSDMEIPTFIRRQMD
jgi:cell division protein FtsZ